MEFLRSRFFKDCLAYYWFKLEESSHPLPRAVNFPVTADWRKAHLLSAENVDFVQWILNAAIKCKYFWLSWFKKLGPAYWTQFLILYQTDPDLNTGSTCFWASRIRIHLSEVWIWIRILLSSRKISKKNLDSYCFVTSFGLFVFEKWCKCTFKN